MYKVPVLCQRNVRPLHYILMFTLTTFLLMVQLCTSHANGHASVVRFIGAVTASKFPVCDTLVGVVSTPGLRDGLYYHQASHLLNNYCDIDEIGAYVCFDKYLHSMTATS